MKKQYWFYIDTYVHISVKNRAILLYNSYTGKILEYYDNIEILRLARRLQSPENLHVILLEEAELKIPVVREFVNEIMENFMGDLIDASYSEGKPIQMHPIVKIQKDVKFLKSESIRSVGEEIMEYLSEVSIYINNRCDQSCSICSRAYRQFPCCTKLKTRNRELDIGKINDLLEEVKSCPIVNLNILGGDILFYSKFEELLALLHPLTIMKTYYLHFKNVVSHKSRLSIIKGSNTRLKILVTFPLREEKLMIVMDAITTLGLDFSFIFIIQSERDFEKAEALISLLSVDKPVFQAFYNGNNLDFFKENIYIGREDIEKERPSLKDIYVREAVNSLNFGCLTILSNGRFYANVNTSSLGNLGSLSIYDIVFKEMDKGKSWRKIRKNVLPCKNCNYEKLCPPISNYNTAIGKNNLCHIWPCNDI